MKIFDINETTGKVTLSLTVAQWIKWIGIILVLGAGGGSTWFGLTTANKAIDMNDRWTGTQHNEYAAEQNIRNIGQDAQIDYNKLSVGNTTREVEKREPLVSVIPLIQQDIQYIKDSNEEQKQIDIYQSKSIEELGAKLNKVGTGVEVLLERTKDK